MDAIVDFFRSIWGLWLMALFLFAVFWAYRPRNKKKYEDAANIPLNDDPPEVGTQGTDRSKNGDSSATADKG